MTPILTVLTAVYEVCGEVACERDLLWTDDDDEVSGVSAGGIVCRGCAENEREEV